MGTSADNASAASIATAVAPATSNASSATAFLSAVPGLEHVTVSNVVQPSVAALPIGDGTDDDEALDGVSIANVLARTLVPLIAAAALVVLGALCLVRGRGRLTVVRFAGSKQLPTRTASDDYEKQVDTEANTTDPVVHSNELPASDPASTESSTSTGVEQDRILEPEAESKV